MCSSDLVRCNLVLRFQSLQTMAALGKSHQFSSNLVHSLPPSIAVQRKTEAKPFISSSCGLGEGVVIKAGFSILPPDVPKMYFKTKFEPQPAYSHPTSDSAQLSAQIKNFLKRSDHLEEKWKEKNGRKTMSPRRIGPTFVKGGSLSPEASSESSF